MTVENNHLDIFKYNFIALAIFDTDNNAYIHQEEQYNGEAVPSLLYKKQMIEEKDNITKKYIQLENLNGICSALKSVGGMLTPCLKPRREGKAPASVKNELVSFKTLQHFIYLLDVSFLTAGSIRVFFVFDNNKNMIDEGVCEDKLKSLTSNKTNTDDSYSQYCNNVHENNNNNATPKSPWNNEATNLLDSKPIINSSSDNNNIKLNEKRTRNQQKIIDDFRDTIITTWTQKFQSIEEFKEYLNTKEFDEVITSFMSST